MRSHRGFVGERVAQARKEAGLTQAELGARVTDYLGGNGWPKQVVSAIERGIRSVTVEDVLAMAGVLGCSVHWLLIPDLEDWTTDYELSPGISLKGVELLRLFDPEALEQGGADYKAMEAALARLDEVRERIETAWEGMRKAAEEVHKAEEGSE